jgi:hemerythrin-like domain-containing protein
MSNMLRRLRQDHANLQKLLVILERQIAALDRCGRPDWDIIEGAVDYLLTYPDLRHHPAEDRILRRLQAKNPSAAAPFQGLEAEHREHAAALRRIAAATRHVLQDASMARQGYLGLLSGFVAALRDHIRKEEAGFFPAAERSLAASDWEELERGGPDLTDPLAGDPAERRLAALRRDFDSWDAADRFQRQAD